MGVSRLYNFPPSSPPGGKLILTENSLHRKRKGFIEKVLCIIHSVFFFKLERYSHYTGQIIKVKLNHVEQKCWVNTLDLIHET